MNVTVIIPSYKPDDKLVTVVKSLVDEGFEDILVINDGSGESYEPYFNSVASYKECTVIKHEVNKGKGCALKTGFRYCIDNRKDISGVVTVDGDNQHKATDIKKCCTTLLEDKDKVILGVRDFSGSDVPFKSKFGNNMTSFVFRFACGIKISDTQTGLRAIPYKYLDMLCRVKGERYEYETNMLLELNKRHIEFKEEVIQTVYIEDNASSHFNPIRDSIKIYGVIFKFLFSSAASSLIDIGIFSLPGLLLVGKVSDSARIFVATLVARVISSIFNYTFNRNAVFESKGNIRGSFVRYYILCAVQLLVSYGLVYFITHILALNPILTIIAKIVVDTVLFLISFQIQRAWVFKE
ncbi:MAG: bifunctional glycosyltransferase family 2/GtrA family protein [Lachnospira sp.]|nr:bifunctional glycosyltransferase family 2/GtrA family protein [Lachnospira sp.]